MWEFTGDYDPVTHEALCADLICNAPAADEIGKLISTQMTVALVQSDSVTVTKSGPATATSTRPTSASRCGNKCVAPYNAGSGHAHGQGRAAAASSPAGPAPAPVSRPRCTVSAIGHVDVGAIFTTVPAGGGGGGGGGAVAVAAAAPTNPTLSVKTAGGKGVVTSTPGGINCGKICTASVAAGTAVTLTATPEAGFTFVNWSGACTGNAATCTVTVNGSATAQANFTK